MPGLEPGIGGEKPQQVALRVGRKAVAFDFIGHAWGRFVVEQIIVRLFLVFFLHHAALGVGRAVEPQMGIDVAVQGKADVHEMLDYLKSVAFDVIVDAGGVSHGVVNHVAVGIGKHDIVFEKIDVPDHVRGHHQVGDIGVGVKQKGHAGIVVEDDLIDF